MAKMPVSEWMGVSCCTEGDYRAIRSWFGGFVPEEWGNPVKADILEHCESGRTVKVRALFVLPEGALREATHTPSSGRYALRRPSPAILRGFRLPAVRPDVLDADRKGVAA